MSYYLTIALDPTTQEAAMYEMYPDAWPVAANRQMPVQGKPRRRPRKEHSVTPVVLGQTDASKAAHAA